MGIVLISVKRKATGSGSVQTIEIMITDRPDYPPLDEFSTRLCRLQTGTGQTDWSTFRTQAAPHDSTYRKNESTINENN